MKENKIGGKNNEDEKKRTDNSCTCDRTYCGNYDGIYDLYEQDYWK